MSQAPEPASTPVHSGYAPVNGLQMYYEIHGSGEPLVMLHGAYMSIDAIGPLLPGLASHRQVIAVELQGHGRTADIDRPISYEQLADDVVAFMRYIGVDNADVFGFSLGAVVAFRVASQYPQLVRKVIATSGYYTSDGIYPEVRAQIDQITPEVFAGTPMEDEYRRLAPNPEDFPNFVRKMTDFDRKDLAWPSEDISRISAPALLIIADADIVKPEHTVEMFRLLGGGDAGDDTSPPKTRMAILPGTNHMVILDQSDLLLSIIKPFLDAPMPGDT